MATVDRISPNISYREATASQTAARLGIKNEPNEEQLLNMQYVANEIFERVRSGLGNIPLLISSFFRSIKLNKNVPGSSKTSQHSTGEAMDIDSEKDNVRVFKYILENLEFDQLIWEYGDKKYPDWVHVSKKRNGQNRKMVLRCYRDKEGNPVYIPFDLKI